MSKRPPESERDENTQGSKGEQRKTEELPPSTYLPPEAGAPVQSSIVATDLTTTEDVQNALAERDSLYVPADAVPANKGTPWTPEDDLRLYQMADEADFSKTTWYQVCAKYNDKHRPPREVATVQRRFDYLRKKGHTINSLTEKVHNPQQPDAPKSNKPNAWRPSEKQKLWDLVANHSRPYPWPKIAKEYNDRLQPHRTSKALSTRHEKHRSGDK